MKRNRIFKLGLILMFIPLLTGLFFYDYLPDQMAVNFGPSNQPNSYASKEFTLFGLPMISILVYVLAYFFINKDPKKANQDEKAVNITLLFIPLISILVTVLIIGYALGYQLDIGFWVSIAVGMLFILIGNYMPKVKRNYTMGIKVPWTLESDLIWEKTHRLAGYLWILGGIVLIVGYLFFRKYLLIYIILTLILLAIIPVIYSYILYSRSDVNGTE